MKTYRPAKSAKQGNTLIVALFLCMILSISIAGYLRHESQQNYLSMRSQSWNTSIAVTEAGIEEALQHLNASYTNLSTDGWTAAGSSTYVMSRSLSSSSRYTVTIDASSINKPVITSQAYITPTSLGFAAPATMFAVGGINAPTDGSPVLSRAVRVTAGRSSLFLKALVAKHGITMHGNGVMTDSFDSTDPAHSDNGMYPSGNLSKLLDNGDIASNDSAIGIVDAGNANVYGHVAVGPKGTISLGPNGGVGTHAWQSFNGGVEPGYFTDDMNFTFPSVTLPFKVGLTPTSGTISTTNYTYVSGTTNITSSTYPNPVPASGVQTNATYATVSYIPNPVPYGLTTNVLTTTTTTTTMPAAGTYLGTYTVTTITSGPKSGRGTYYTYNLITGTNYTYPTLSYTYSYATYTTNFTVTTASYDNIIQGGAPNLPPVDYYVGSLSGSVYVRGNARLVVNGNCSVGDLTIDSDGVLQMYVNGSSLSRMSAGDNQPRPCKCM